ncbi:hypothetical protein BDV97DRAFT_192370 [Delphinella strobiligena]|nr:hypothetical protein BDV97DRAFT_192370 [Delphinella strobiligena]
MGKGFDIRTSMFKHGRQHSPQNDEEKDVLQRPSSGFLRAFTQRLPKNAKRRGKRGTQIIELDPPGRGVSVYNDLRAPSMQPLSMRPPSHIIMPPPHLKEPAILSSWGEKKSPSLRPNSYLSHDSALGRNNPGRSPLSASFSPKPEPISPKPEPIYLTRDELQAMFDGAPQFEFVNSPTRPQPKVTLLRSTNEEYPENLTDVEDFAHPTFAITSLYALTGEAMDEEGEKNWGKEVLSEVQDMRSFTDRDAGTVGYAYFLQSLIADSRLTEPDNSSSSKRLDLLLRPEKLGLQALDLQKLIARLSELGEDHHIRQGSPITAPSEQKAAEMYTDLFSELLVTSKHSFTALEEDLTGLEVQVAALVEALDITELWYDFSYVEWRVRLGSLLWSAPDKEQSGTSACEEEAANERDIVLIQVTLASELLARLEMSGKPVEKRSLSRKIQWDLVIAKRFLENIRITSKPAEETRNNRSSVFSAMTFVTANETLEDADQAVEPILYPRDETRQLEGLLKFAEALSWPHTQDITSRFQDRNQRHSLLTPAPIPVEAASHFLISTLLENAPQAIERLGDAANLYGGFIYNGRSYWSKSCIVGRVLAAQQGAGECLGWISAPSVPLTHAEDWVDIETKDVTNNTVRISSEIDIVAKDSAFVPGKDNDANIERSDFTWPVDSPPVMGNEARYDGLVLFPSTASTMTAPSSSVESQASLLPPSTASLKFAPKKSTKAITVPLVYDVSFISSFPCFPSVSPLQKRDSLHTPSPIEEFEKRLSDPPCHPLHSSYVMEIVPALELLARAWCARVGEHALVAKVGRTCLACCVREARGLGVKIVIRV